MPIDLAVDLILEHHFNRLNDAIGELPDIGEKLVENPIYKEIFNKAQEDSKSALKSLLLGTENGQISIKDYCQILIRGGYNQLKNKIMDKIDNKDENNENDKNKKDKDQKKENDKNKKDKGKKNENDKNKNKKDNNEVLKNFVGIIFETSDQFVEEILNGNYPLEKIVDIFLDAGFKGFDKFFLENMFNTLNEEEKVDSEENYEKNFQELKNMALKGTEIGIRSSFEIIFKKVFTEGFSPSILKEAILIGGFQKGYKYFKEEANNWIVNQNEYFKFYNDNIAMIFEKYFGEI